MSISCVAALFIACVFNPAANAEEGPHDDSVVNPANLQALGLLQARIRREFMSRPIDLESCRNCAANNTLGAVVEDLRVWRQTQPNVTCDAEPPGFNYSCIPTGGAIEISGRWFVGQYTWVSGRIRQQGSPLAAGRFRLTARNYTPVWRATLNRFHREPSETWYTTNMRCSKLDPIPDGADFAFGLTRTSGSESPELSPVIENLARQAVVDYYCRAMQAVQVGRGSWLSTLSDSLKLQMTWLERDAGPRHAYVTQMRGF